MVDMDSELFWKLLKPVHPSVAAFCRRLAGDADDGDDLYHQALLKAMRRFDTLRDHTSFRAWLYRIVVNTHRNSRRSWWWRLRRPMTPESEDSAGTVDPRPAHDSRRRLAQLLKVLSAQDQALVVLYEIEGWSVAELASLFKRPVGTIKTRLARSRRKLRRRLEQDLSAGETIYSVGETTYALPRSETSD